MEFFFFNVYIFFFKTVSAEAFPSAVKTAVAGAQASCSAVPLGLT